MAEAPFLPCLRSCRLAAVLIAACIAATSQASELRQTAIVRAVQQARPSVVNIHGRKTVREQNDQGEFRQVNGMGTGVVIDPRGYIITNYHVVEDVGRIQVTLADKTTLIGTLVAHDSRSDLAILKINSDKPLPVLKIGTSSDLMPGEPVVAVGNAFGYEHTVTRGIISALHRSVQVSDTQQYNDLIQTDASINPGNSGGPLLNIDGDMIAINVAVRVGAQGIGFAIPIDEAMEIAARLMRVETAGIAHHGVVGKTTFAADGAPTFTVKSVSPGSAAEAGGVRPGDVVSQAGDIPVSRSIDLERALVGSQPNQQLPLTIQRDGSPVSLTLHLSQAVQVASHTPADQSWNTLGLRLEAVAAQQVQRINPRYRGGMKVVAVRQESPAAQEGIRPGDVLLGVHKWETISMDNVSYILKNMDATASAPIRFYILRGGDTLYGDLRLASRP